MNSHLLRAMMFGRCIAMTCAAVVMSTQTALAGVAIPTPLAGFLGLPGWAALGAGYGAVVLARRLRSKR